MNHLQGTGRVAEEERKGLLGDEGGAGGRGAEGGQDRGHGCALLVVVIVMEAQPPPPCTCQVG